MLPIFVLRNTTMQEVVSFCHGRIYFLYVGNCFMKHLIKKNTSKGRICKYIISDIVHNNGMDCALTLVVSRAVSLDLILYCEWIVFWKISQNNGFMGLNCFFKMCQVTWLWPCKNEWEVILSIFSQSKSMNAPSESFIGVRSVQSAVFHYLKSISTSSKSSLSSTIAVTYKIN